MGLPVLILGYSGTGKSTSMRNFKEDELALVNVNNKPLPFSAKFETVLNTDNYIVIEEFIAKQTLKTVVIDDSQFLMANEFMRRSKEVGFQKFTDIGKNFWGLVKFLESLPNDVIIYFLHHLEASDEGREKAKTIGKLLDDKIVIESMFTTVLKTVVTDGKYYFATQNSGADTCKTPLNLFDKLYIENDLKFVDERLRLYYKLKPVHNCADCNEIIMPTPKATVDAIVDFTTKNHGRKLCAKCATAEKRKKNEAVSASS